MLFAAPDTPLRKVISASRRTDLATWHPDFLADKIEAIGHDNIHTLVIWTKNPRNILTHGRLHQVLKSLDQIYIHLTITGMGGSDMEPDVPDSSEILALLPGLVDFIGSPLRIAWRFDPLLWWRKNGSISSNYESFPTLALPFSRHKIGRGITSICTLYPKVLKRFAYRSDLVPVEPSPDDRSKAIYFLQKCSGDMGLDLSFCCHEGMAGSGCINGNLLTALHPLNLPTITEPAAGQRPACHCTKSLDIGWYSQKCRSGCLYCYADPAIRFEKSK
jgi:hypothetical protein